MFDDRDLDVASLIALWLAIHGGDPGPSEIAVDDKTAALIAAALDSQLANTVEFARREDRTPARLEERLKSFGIEVTPDVDKSCFTFKIKVPVLADPKRFTTMTVRVCLHIVG